MTSKSSTFPLLLYTLGCLLRVFHSYCTLLSSGSLGARPSRFDQRSGIVASTGIGAACWDLLDQLRFHLSIMCIVYTERTTPLNSISSI
jgi:hypothetical protein